MTYTNIPEQIFPDSQGTFRVHFLAANPLSFRLEDTATSHKGFALDGRCDCLNGELLHPR